MRIEGDMMSTCYDKGGEDRGREDQGGQPQSSGRSVQALTYPQSSSMASSNKKSENNNKQFF